MTPSGAMQESEYEKVVKLHTADPSTERVKGINNKASWNLNRIGKAVSE